MKNCPYCNNACKDGDKSDDCFHRLFKNLNSFFEPFIIGTVYGLTICNMIAIVYWSYRAISYLVSLWATGTAV